VFDGRFRSIVDKRVGPIGTALGRTGLSPDHLTALGLLMAVPAALAIGTGRLGLGLVLLIASAVPDLLDGALAKAKGTASKRGAFFDSVADRVTDALILGGVAWYLQTSRHGHASLLPFGVLAVSMLISYQRAKAESLGFTAKGGLMERAERIILLCVGLVAPVILVPILWLMLVLTAATAVQRFAKVWRQASVPGAPEGGVPNLPSGAAVAGVGVDGAEVGGGGVEGSVRGEAIRDPSLAQGALANGARGQTPGGTVHEARWTDPDAAMAERWRAWRQQTGRQGAGRMPPAARPTGIAREADDSRRSTRWEDRRAARLRANSEAKSAPRTPGGRRHGTRRP
jgi:CDP-diacylglycerol---glycerol-3-phosphate 3-phosphatidyltransferase